MNPTQRFPAAEALEPLHSPMRIRVAPDWFGAARTEAVRFVFSDMWKAYLRVIAERAGQAVHVLDRF